MKTFGQNHSLLQSDERVFMRTNAVCGLFGLIGTLFVSACSSDDDHEATATGGMSSAGTGGTGMNTAATTTGGKSGPGTSSNMGGSVPVAGNAATGGMMMHTGGLSSAGGMPNTGGSSPVGTSSAAGGMPNSGGAMSTGGMIHTGGMSNVGGSASGGMMSTGGVMNMGGMTHTNGSAAGGMMSSGGMMNTGGMSSIGGQSGATQFKLRIENRSAMSALPTLLAPGAYALVNDGSTPFTTDTMASPGLEMAAEDANPATLLSEIMDEPGVSASAVFNTPVGASTPGPLHPGDAYEVLFEAVPGEKLHFESMIGQSNDTYATTAAGIALFGDQGEPISGDVTSAISLWDSGTERNEAPGMGPNQAPRQSAPDTGPSEAGVALRTDGTRSIPIPSALVDVSVSLASGVYSVTLKNKSDQGPLMSPLSPAFYALHAASYHYFSEGAVASAGLERLAEEGNSSVLVSEANAAGAMAATAGTAAYGPGESVIFGVTPTSERPLLSLAMMIGQTNDVFVGTRPQGVPLLDNLGMLRPAIDVQADIMNLLAVWDAGTEANEAPGVGSNQAPRQAAANTGPVDPNNQVRLYADSTNDFAHLADKVSVVISHASGTTFEVTVTNASASSAFPLIMSPVAWAVHGVGFSSFTLGAPASAGIEHLAEDGASTTLLSEWTASSQVDSSGVAGTAPFASGASVSFQVTPDAAHRYLSIEAMLVPSNDTFAALGPMGVALLDASGNPRTDEDIAADVMLQLAAYDAGTEANQGSALGPAMAPYQTAPNTGANEGSTRVRPVDAVWPLPSVQQLLRVTLMPM